MQTKKLFRSLRLPIATLLLAMSANAVAATDESVTVSPPTGEDICLFSSLDLSKITYFDDNGKTAVRANRTTLNNPIVLKDTLYTSGVGTHAPSKAIIDVNGATRFTARLGVDDEASSADAHGIVDYVISTYKDKVATVVMQGTIRRTDANTVAVDIDLAGCDYLVLDLQSGAQKWADQVSWGNACFEYSGTAPATVLEGDMYLDTERIVNLPEVGRDGAEIIPLSLLEIEKAINGWGTIRANRSIEGNPITLKDTVYTSGVGAHATNQIIVKLNGAVTHFVTRVGIDDEVRSGAGTNANYGVCDYRVSLKAENGDVRVVAQGTVRATDTTTPLIDVDCNGWKYLILEADEGQGGNSFDHVDWANAYFEYIEQNSTPPAIVSAEEISSKLACATIVFSQPGVRFMQKIRTTNPEAVVTVDNLPDGLTWNAKRQLVEGIVETEGTYSYTAHINSDGNESDEVITLTVSANLQQPVPFMGWLSWNVVQGEISEDVVRTVADAMVASGLADKGYRYLVIDDLWHANARESGTNKPVEDPAKFPNGIGAAADYTHSKGLKFGIYSDGGTHTCAGKFGSYGYEAIDANQYAEWGVDLLKYDYCNAPAALETCKARYRAMGDALKATGRNILFYMCEWGVREPWKWGTETGASTWRCTYDTRDGWQGRSGGIGIVESVQGMKDLWAYSGPNRFNDADMMCVGIHGTGKSSNDLVQGTPGMTQTEYRTQFSLWCMWASPLTLSFDLRKPISDDDMAIMGNEELIAINQDRMGLQAELVSEDGDVYTFMKDLENGDVAVAVLNMGGTAQTVNLDFGALSALEEGAEYLVRDLWAHEEKGTYSDAYTVSVAPHETQVFRLSKKENTAVGIASAKSGMNVSVKTSRSGIRVSCPGTDGQTKRILVSDTAGHVVASARGTKENFVLPIKAGSGVYVANVVCSGVSRSVKVTI